MFFEVLILQVVTLLVLEAIVINVLLLIAIAFQSNKEQKQWESNRERAIKKKTSTKKVAKISRETCIALANQYIEQSEILLLQY